MPIPPTARSSVLVAILALLSAGLTSGDGPAPTAEQDNDPAVLKPHWQIGDQWTVRTTSLRSQVADHRLARSRTGPIDWRFAVKEVVHLGARECYRVEAHPMIEGRARPTTTLWFDRHTLALKRFQTELPVAGGFRTVSENYDFSGGEPSPVLGPLSALPVDMPSFVAGRSKGPETFVYRSTVGPAGQKDFGGVGFVFEVRQQVTRPAEADVRELPLEASTKDLSTRPMLDVTLEGSQCRVRQLWQPGRPWPVYADNGTTIARLVEVIPAQHGSSRPSE